MKEGTDFQWSNSSSRTERQLLAVFFILPYFAWKQRSDTISFHCDFCVLSHSPQVIHSYFLHGVPCCTEQYLKQMASMLYYLGQKDLILIVLPVLCCSSFFSVDIQRHLLSSWGIGWQFSLDSVKVSRMEVLLFLCCIAVLEKSVKINKQCDIVWSGTIPSDTS